MVNCIYPRRKPRMNKIYFTKMHGLGNDFVVIHSDNLPHLPVSTLADRHQGIGFDQLLVIEPSSRADFFCRIFNADGSEAEQCGNGLRCVARYLYEHHLSKKEFSLETKAGVYPIKIENFDKISVGMGVPRIQHPTFHLHLPHHTSPIEITVLDVGNPHAIIRVNELNPSQTRALGEMIATHTDFPNGINVGFMQIKNKHHIALRTYERGTGETLACGSNACAAVAAGMTQHGLKSPVSVEYCYGSLEIAWDGDAQPIHLTGPAVHVFSGEISI